MSSALETALLEYVLDVMDADCGVQPDRYLRYHGFAGVPADCCTDNGALSIAWDNYYYSDRWPQSSAQSAGPCLGVPALSLRLKYQTCWPIPDNAASVSPEDYTKADTVAAKLVDLTACVSAALVSFECGNPPDPDDLWLEVRAASGPNQLRFGGAEPISPSGGCTGVVWKLVASPRPVEAVS